MRRVPVLIVTGFLGAGKTTLMNRLIEYYTNQGKRIGVIVNEFGNIGIDGELYRKGDYIKIELNKGSIFCICIRTDFIKELSSLADLHPDIILIEATGIANSTDMRGILQQESLIKNKVYLACNICVVDAKNFLKIINTLEAVKTQIKEADIILINKSQSSSPSVLKEIINKCKEYNNTATFLQTNYCKIDPSIIKLEPERISNIPIENIPPEPVYSFSFEFEGQINLKRFKEVLEELIKQELLRAKGFVKTPEGDYFFEYLPHNINFKRWSVRDKNVMVFIGKRINKTDIEEKLKKVLLN